MSSVPPDQQPIARIVGRRTQPPVGTLPSPEARAAAASWAKRLTCAPKGVFRYANHQEMASARDRWRVQAIVETQRRRA